MGTARRDSAAVAGSLHLAPVQNHSTGFSSDMQPAEKTMLGSWLPSVAGAGQAGQRLLGGQSVPGSGPRSGMAHALFGIGRT